MKYLKEKDRYYSQPELPNKDKDRLYVILVDAVCEIAAQLENIGREITDINSCLNSELTDLNNQIENTNSSLKNSLRELKSEVQNVKGAIDSIG